jgi:myo-inositol-1(or 4)-monophosphatase
MPLPDKVLTSVQEIAKQAGHYLINEQQSFSRESLELKGKNDLVSYVDRNTEKIIFDGLQTLVPEAGFLGEETGISGSDAEWLWVVDPLDGTTNFIHGLPLFSVSIGLLHHNKPYLGVVYDPYREELFSAELNKGSWLNGVRIYTSPETSLERSLLATGFPYFNFQQLPEYLSLLGDLMASCHGMRRMGTAAIDLAWTACGRFEGFFEYNLSPWDVAAGTIIVTEAGGIVNDFENNDNPLFGKQILASNKNIYKPLLEKIRHHFYELDKK